MAIVNFHPSVVAPLVVPIGHARGPSWHPDTAAGIDQQDRQAGAGGHALFDGFAGALVGRAPLGVVVHVDEIEELPIQGLSGFGGGGAVGHQWCAAFQEVGPPRFAAFIEDGIRQDIIEEALLGNLFGPHKVGSCLHRKIKIFDEQFCGQFLVVAWRMFLQERSRSAAQSTMLGFGVLGKGFP